MPCPLLVRMVCLLALTTASAFAQDAAKASRFYEDALRRYENKDIPGAIIQLKNALQADKNQLSVQLLLGRVLLADNQPAAAEVALSEALRLGVDRAEVAVPLAMAMNTQGKQPQMLQDPRLAPAGLPPGVKGPLLLERALAQSDMGDNKASLETVLQARALDPGDVNSWLAEVPLRIRARQFGEAQAAADQALKLAPESAEAFYQKGSIFHATGNVREALNLYAKALQLQPRHAESHLARAGLWVDLNRDADALADVDALQKLKPNDPRGTYLRAVLAERAGNSQATRVALKKVTELLDPVAIENIRYRPQFLMLNGLAHYGLGEREKAKPYLELAARQQAGDPLNKLLAQIALQETNVNRAIELLEAYLQVHPSDRQALLMLTSAYMTQGKHGRAAKLMQDALKAQDSPEYRTALGLSLLQSGRTPLGAEELAKAFKADPTQTYAGLALVTVHLRDGQMAKALAVADSLATSQPKNATVLLVQAYARTQAARYAAARSGYEKALTLDPTLMEAKLGLARLDTLTGNYEAANKRLRELLRAEPRNVNLLFELALLNEQWKKDDEAANWLESAAEASGPRQTQANFALVAWYLRKGPAAKALTAAKNLLGKLPDDAEALQAYAAAQVANSDVVGAKLSLTNAARRAGYDAPRLVEVARQQMEIRDFPGAAYSLDKALHAVPDFLPAQAMMASVDLARGDAASSERLARQVLQASPKTSLGYNLLADIAQSRGQAGAALDALRKAHEIDRDSASLARLMRAMTAESRFTPALDLGESWLQRHPNDWVVRNVMAELLVRKHDLPAARKQYQAILKQRPQHAQTLNNLANLLMEMQDPGALAAAEAGYRVDPRDPMLMDTAGWANHLAGNSDRALQLLREARLRAPNTLEIRYHLAVVLVKLGRKTEAREELQTGLRDSVASATAHQAKQLLSTLN